MFQKLLQKTTTAVKTGKKLNAAVATPDISRVMKPRPAPPPAPSVDLDEVQVAERAEAAVESFADQFDAWMRGDFEALRAAWEVASQPGATPDDYRAMYTCAHNMRGAAPSYGYPAVSRLCGSLCALLGQTRPGENAALINLHVEACRASVNAARTGGTSDSVADAVCDALERRVMARSAKA